MRDARQIVFENDEFEPDSRIHRSKCSYVHAGFFDIYS
jgi:hypothetical protein